MKKLGRTIRAIFFDYGGTLDAPGIAWRDHFYPIYLEAGINVSPHRFAKAFYAADDSLVAENPVHMSLSDVVHEQVKRVLKHLGAYDKKLHHEISHRFLQDTFDHVAKILPVLKRAKAHFKTGIISNNYGNLENICRELGLDGVMDVVVDSNLTGYTKPNEKIFKTALEALQVDAASAVMVGDSFARDIKGAQAVGMAAIWLAAEHGKANEKPKGPEAIISHICELPEILGI